MKNIIFCLIIFSQFAHARTLMIPQRMETQAIAKTYIVKAIDRDVEGDWFNLDPYIDEVEGVSSNKVYETMQIPKEAQEVIVAVIDSGVDIQHPDLAGKIWVNKGEIPGNGIDDDKNGYIDDIHGWSFLGNADGTNIDQTNLEETRILRKLLLIKKVRSLTSSEQELFDVVKSLVDAGLRSDPADKYYDVNFDPRSIIGDNWENTADRNYGNNDVTGPDSFHGTHVAGIIAADRKNGLGISGIASKVKIMALRAVPDGDEYDKDIANSIYYAVDNGAKIINMSFGKKFSPQRSAIDKAMKYAHKKGVLMVHAAGNSHNNNDVSGISGNFPTRFTLKGKNWNHWLEVGASTQSQDSLPAYFSNYGQKTVDLFAPGYQILSTIPGGGYKKASGTSMASPVVAGVAALVLSLHPELKPSELRELFQSKGTKYSGLQVSQPGTGDRVDFSELSISGGVANAFSILEAI